MPFLMCACVCGGGVAALKLNVKISIFVYADVYLLMYVCVVSGYIVSARYFLWFTFHWENNGCAVIICHDRLISEKFQEGYEQGISAQHNMLIKLTCCPFSNVSVHQWMCVSVCVSVRLCVSVQWVVCSV